MSLFGTLGKYVGLQAEGAESGVHALLAKLDGEGYSEAIIRQMESEHATAAQELSKAKREWQREQGEAEAAEKGYIKLLDAAKAMQADLETNPSDKLQAAFDKTVAGLKQMKIKVETEKAEAEAAKALLDAVEQEVNDYASALRNARSNMQQAQAQNKLSEVQLRTAEREAELAKRKNGSKSRLDTLSAGLNAFNAEAEKNRDKAAALKATADLNRTPDLTEDDTIAKYMGGGSAPKSNSDALAGLDL